MEITRAHEAVVGQATVRRLLPRATRRTIGAWCFADHAGPIMVDPDRGLDVGPHPHMGLQTVTWLRQGELLHRDSTGAEQVIRPGQLNVMTAGRGVSHSEECTSHYRGALEALQLWIAQPDATRHGPASFEHLSSLPHLDLGSAAVTLMVGRLLDAVSPAVVATPLMGADVIVRGDATLPLQPEFEYGLIVLAGVVEAGGQVLTPAHLGYLTTGNEEVGLRAVGTEPAQVVVLGGEPFPERIRMWWNFVGRDPEDFVDAYKSWVADDGRFGTVTSDLQRVLTNPPPNAVTRDH